MEIARLGGINNNFQSEGLKSLDDMAERGFVDSLIKVAVDNQSSGNLTAVSAGEGKNLAFWDKEKSIVPRDQTPTLDELLSKIDRLLEDLKKKK